MGKEEVEKKRIEAKQREVQEQGGSKKKKKYLSLFSCNMAGRDDDDGDDDGKVKKLKAFGKFIKKQSS